MTPPPSHVRGVIPPLILCNRRETDAARRQGCQATLAGGVSLEVHKTERRHANARRLNASHHPTPALYYRRAMQGWCHAHAAGLAPSVARARQRVKGEAAPSSRRRDLRHKACSVRELRRARMRGWCRKEGGRAPARRRDHWTATAPSLQRCPFERRRDDDPCAVVRDARELPLGEDDGRHPLVTVYSFNT